jgi:hypothetical protein
MRLETRRLRADSKRRRIRLALVVLGWTPRGKPVASIPVHSHKALEERIRIWRYKGYKISTVIEWDFY